MDVWWNNHFLYKDLVHHPIETSICKWLFGVPGCDLEDSWALKKAIQIAPPVFTKIAPLPPQHGPRSLAVKLPRRTTTVIHKSSTNKFQQRNQVMGMFYLRSRHTIRKNRWKPLELWNITNPNFMHYCILSGNPKNGSHLMTHCFCAQTKPGWWFQSPWNILVKLDHVPK